MKIITIASLKGGVGKTTLAAGLAGALSKNSRVTAIDFDYKGNFTEYLNTVYSENPKVETMTIENIYEPSFISTLRERLQSMKTDYVLIDTPREISAGLRAALSVSDLVLCPVSECRFSLHGFNSISSEVEKAEKSTVRKIPVIACLSNVSNSESQRVRESKTFRKIAGTAIHRAAGIKKAMNDFHSLRGKAAAEFESMAAEIRGAA